MRRLSLKGPLRLVKLLVHLKTVLPCDSHVLHLHKYERASLSISDVDHEVIIRELIDLTVNIFRYSYANGRGTP
jgi:hypothetical protein